MVNVGKDTSPMDAMGLDSEPRLSDAVNGEPSVFAVSPHDKR